MRHLRPLSHPNTARGANVVTAAVPAAARAGLDVLRAGGNAFDAAVAAALVETVWLPMKCGLAGDLVALWLREGTAIECLISIGGGAAALDRGERPAVIGPRSVGVPGAPAGYAALAAAGRFPLAELVELAVAEAEHGVHWLPTAVSLTRQAEAELRRHNGSIRYLPAQELPRAGDRLQLPGLASVLRAFGRTGAALFHGEFGQHLVRKVEAGGGFLDAADLRQDTLERSAPLVCPIEPGCEVLLTPMPTHGPLVARALEVIARSGTDTLTAFQSARSSFAPVAGDGTSVVTVADRAGNAVVVVHSNSFPQYGSSLVVEELDLVLNNRPGRGFSCDAPADHWNAPRAGRRPFTTLNAWAARRGGITWLGATPGGINQAPWNLQVLTELLAGEADIGRLVTNPRWGFDRKGEVTVEADHPGASNLPAEKVAPWSMRSAQQILAIDSAGGVTRAAADPRMGAMALATD